MTCVPRTIPPRLLLLTAVFLETLHASLAKAEGADDNEVCVFGDVSEDCIAKVSEDAYAAAFPQNLIWPPSWETLPNLAILALVAWSVVALALVNRESIAEKTYQQKRARQVVAQLAQTQYEHEEGTKKWATYNARKAVMRDTAKERLTKLKEGNPACTETEEELYQCIIAETGFASEDPPEAALDPKRVFEVLIDEVDDCPVTHIKHIAERLGPDGLSDLNVYFDAVRKILLERLLDKLGKLVSKTQSGFENANDPRFKCYASGTKLMECIALAKKVTAQFYPSPFFGLGRPRAPDGDEDGKQVLAKLHEANTIIRTIKKNQPSRMAQILSFFEAQTFLYMGCASLTRIFGGAIGPIRGFLFNLVVVNASQENWQEQVAYNLACIGVVFFFDWYVNDWVSMVSTTKATSLVKHALRTKLFDAVLRQDAEYFEAHDGGEVCDRVQHDVNRVADHAIYIPMDIVGIVSSMMWHILLMRAYCPGMLTRTLVTGAFIAPLFMALNRLTNKLRKKDDRTMRAINSNTNDMLQKVKAVREFSREKQEAAELDRGAR